MSKIEFISSEDCLYHIYNRGVEKRDVFLDDSDYLRFIHDLFEFNNDFPASKFIAPKNLARTDLFAKKRDLLVEILCYCLMPNHFHLLLRQKKDQGIARFMQKLGTGYTMYFNERYQRSGVLFQGRFKAVLVDNEAYFKHLPYYIHSNPLDLSQPNWKEEGIKNLREALNFLSNYRWSSYLDYIGKKNFPSVISMDFFENLWGDYDEYKKAMRAWLSLRNKNQFSELMID